MKKYLPKNRKKQLSLQSGFTLIELLASTFVIVAIGGIIVSIIVSTLRGSNKSNTMVTTRENGTYAISQLSKMLRFAQEVTLVDGASPSVCITNIPFPTPQPTYGPLTTHQSITFVSLDGGTTTISCTKFNELTPAPSPTPRVNEPLTIASNGASLLDTTMVEIPSGSCKITCNQSTQSDSLLVGIEFSLVSVQAGSGNLFSEFNATANPIDYQTSVILRNVGR
jgi:type II secretory pathway pseudopilin PulG